MNEGIAMAFNEAARIATREGSSGKGILYNFRRQLTLELTKTQREIAFLEKEVRDLDFITDLFAHEDTSLFLSWADDGGRVSEWL